MPNGQNNGQEQYTIRLGGQDYTFKDKPGLSQADAVQSARSRYPLFAKAYDAWSTTMPTGAGLEPKAMEQARQQTASIAASTIKPIAPTPFGVAPGTPQQEAIIRKAMPQVGEAASDVESLALLPIGVGGAVGALRTGTRLAKAGKEIGAVEEIAKAIPVDTSALEPILDRARELNEAGRDLPAVLQRFAKHMEEGGGPLTFRKARDMYSAAGEVVSKELGDPMARQVRLFRAALGSAVEEAADKVSQGKKLIAAMEEWKNAKSTEQKMDIVKKALKYIGIGALTGAGIAGGAAVGRQAIKELAE